MKCLRMTVGFLLVTGIASLQTAQALLPPEDCAELIGCPAEYDPVCGSNGVTYSNACELKLAACKANDETLAVVDQGECVTEAQTCVAASITQGDAATLTSAKESNLL